MRARAAHARLVVTRALVVASTLAALRVRVAAAQQTGTVTGQATLVVEGRTVPAAAARVTLLRGRPTEIKFNDRTRDSVLAEWRGFWPAESYDEAWRRALFDPAATHRRDAGILAAEQAGRLREYQAAAECQTRVEATDSALALTERQAEAAGKAASIRRTAADEAGRFTFSDVPAGPFLLIVRARVGATEASWSRYDEVKGRKTLQLALQAPAFACSPPADSAP